MPKNTLQFEKIIPCEVESNIKTYNEKMKSAFPDFKSQMTREEHIEDLQQNISQLIGELEKNLDIKPGEKIKVRVILEHIPEEFETLL